MGLRIASMYLLEYSKRVYNMDFSNTISLGRQFAAFTKKEYRKFQSSRNIKTYDEEKSFESPFAEEIFKDVFGKEIKSVDAYDYEGADIIHDFNKPVDESMKNKYTCIIDGGTTEHVFNYPQAIKNCIDMLCVGGHFISMVPTNNFNGHGLYQFSPELFYSLFVEKNGMQIEDIFIVKFSATCKTWRIKNNPEEFGERLQFNINVPTEIFVVAKKISEPEGEIKAHQIDYEKDWYKEGENNKKSSKDSLTGKIPRKLLFTVGQFLYHPLNKNKYIEKINLYKLLKK